MDNESLGYETEAKEYRDRNPSPKFKDWLQDRWKQQREEDMELDEKSEIAALWGSAENVHYRPEHRLQHALLALEKMSKLVPGWDE